MRQTKGKTDIDRGKPDITGKSVQYTSDSGLDTCQTSQLSVYAMLIENSYFNGEVVVVDGGYSYK